MSALINGEKETGVTILLADNDIDTGSIIYQARVPICHTNTIKDLIYKTLPLYIDGLKYAIHSNEVILSEQDESKATYSIWRDAEDYIIDWNQSAEEIERTVRALGKPYLGAKTFIGNKEYIIHFAVAVNDVKFEIRQPGKVWKLKNGYPTIVCGKGMLEVWDASSKINNLRTRFKSFPNGF